MRILRGKKIQVLWVLIWFMQSRSLYFALYSASASIILIEFVTDCCFKRKKKKGNQPSNCQSQQTNSNKTNSQTRKLERRVSLFLHLYAAVLLSVFLFLICYGQERVKIPVIMKLLRYIAGISSLACLGVHLSSFSGVSPCSERQLLCAHVLYGWQGALSSAWAHLLPTQSFSTTFKNMLYILKVTTMCLGSIWIKRQDLISYQKKEILWYMWCGCFFGFVFFCFFGFLFVYLCLIWFWFWGFF